jgi:pyruvate/2-oxoglutarate dehydrogenase complex dihydrolipoamide acyltransferase (E2) component
MLSTLKMPKVGDAVDEVVVKEIKVERGATVSRGDTLFVVETDKAEVEVPAPVAGVISNILISVGDDVKTGAPTIVLDTK